MRVKPSLIITYLLPDLRHISGLADPQGLASVQPDHKHIIGHIISALFDPSEGDIDPPDLAQIVDGLLLGPVNHICALQQNIVVLLVENNRLDFRLVDAQDGQTHENNEDDSDQGSPIELKDS
jgi:hypothetical protein